jgi:hypothetical protein
MLAAVLTPRQLARQVGGNVKCDSGPMVARATRLVTRASCTTIDDSVCFPGEFSVVAGAFALGQVLNFGTLAYVADFYSKLHLLHGAAPVGNEPRHRPLC